VVNIKVKRLSETAKLPEKTNANDTGYDIFVDIVEERPPHNQVIIHTGIAIQPESGYYVEVYPRSSVYRKHMQLANSVAIIDESYTGEIVLIFNKIPTYSQADSSPSLGYWSEVRVGEKIAQMVVRKRIDADFIEVSYLDNTARGDGGFGSTGDGVSAGESWISGYKGRTV